MQIRFYRTGKFTAFLVHNNVSDFTCSAFGDLVVYDKYGAVTIYYKNDDFDFFAVYTD